MYYLNNSENSNSSNIIINDPDLKLILFNGKYLDNVSKNNVDNSNKNLVNDILLKNKKINDDYDT
jgi:hypothetical protein